MREYNENKIYRCVARCPQLFEMCVKKCVRDGKQLNKYLIERGDVCPLGEDALFIDVGSVVL